MAGPTVRAAVRDSADLARSGVPLAAATIIAGLLGYAFNLILTRALGPEAFGSVGALLGAALIASVPATALQLEIARLVAGGRGGSTRWGLRVCTVGALGTCLAALALVPLMDHILRLNTPVDGVLLALLLVPQTLTGGLLGMLLGRGRTGLFALTLISVGVGRLLAAGATQAAGGGSTFALAAAVAGSAAAAGVGLLAVWRSGRGSVAAPAHPTTRELLRGLSRAVAGAGALMLLLNVDLLVARALLDDNDSGQYAFLTIFGRVTFWGTSFLSIWIFPRVAGPGREARAVRFATGVVLAGGATAVAVVSLFGPELVAVLVGPAYAESAPYAPMFATAGALISIIQLATYVDVARGRHQVSLLVCVGAAAIVLAAGVMGLTTIGGIIALTIAVLGVLALLSMGGLWLTSPPLAGAPFPAKTHAPLT